MLPTIISFTLSVWSHLYVSSILAYNSTEQFSFYFPPYIYITYSILNCFTFNVDLWLQAFSSLLTFLVSGTGRSLLDLWAVVVVGKVLNLFPPFSSFLTCHDLFFFCFFPTELPLNTPQQHTCRCVVLLWESAPHDMCWQVNRTLCCAAASKRLLHNKLC